MQKCERTHPINLNLLLMRLDLFNDIRHKRASKQNGWFFDAVVFIAVLNVRQMICSISSSNTTYLNVPTPPASRISEGLSAMFLATHRPANALRT